ncbi:unnamed protein product [Phytomonas sp. Hart1]|nr:unnamed protein product [Phytomonas sp. Hart1]|eukprot:CCW68604.1 unnamed protein product [Phytomonas sp. isolate Hart1]
MEHMLSCMLPYLDKHLALGLLSFYEEKGLAVEDAKAKVLASTALTPQYTVKPEQEERIQATTLRAKPALDEFFEGSDNEDYTYQFKLTASEVEQLRTQSELSYDYLRTKKGITRAVMQAVMELAFLYYDKASYGDASELLALCQCVSGYDLPSEIIIWGKLMCDTGACNWQSAIEMAATIRKNQNSDEEEIFRQANATTIQARAWLLHWVLFPFFKGGSQYPVQLLSYIFDHRSDNIYQSVIETLCPHYLRYVCAAVLLNYTRHSNFKAAAAMTENIYEYSDALTKLIGLIQKFDFEGALELLPEVEKVVQEDFFLCDLEDCLMSKAKRLIFQRYMSLHMVVSIPYVADKLGMSKADAEVWLVNLISDSKQRAKVDSVNEQLNVEPQTRAADALVYDKLESISRK